MQNKFMSRWMKRVFLAGASVSGVLLVSPFCLAEEPAAAVKEVEEFRPDFKTWDVYLPHLKRTHLSGWWRLCLLPDTKENPGEDAGKTEGFQTPGFDDSRWEKAMVPGDWHKPFMVEYAKIDKGRKEFGGVGWYRLSFQAPEVKPGERAILHFDEVIRHAEVYLNGTLVGTHSNPYQTVTLESFELDATDAIRPGQKNVLAVRVFHDGVPMRWIFASSGGITKRVYLDVRPSTWCAETLVTPDEDLRGAGFECVLGGARDATSSTDGWTAEAFEWDSGKIVGKSPVGGVVEKDGQRRVSGKLSIPDAKPWSCESPFLYGLRLKNKAGETVGVRRFGMRTFHARNGAFVLNGKPTMLRGIIMHGEGQLTQVSSTATLGSLFINNEGDALRRFFQAYRAANVNHIRFHSSCLPSAYDVLDELGFLITDEIGYPEELIKNPMRADKIMEQRLDVVCGKDGTLKPEFIELTQRRIHSIYSHPCIATFSFGNEMRDEDQCGKMFNNLYDLYTSLDGQDRPITPSSGRFWKDGGNVESLSKIDQLDYVDTHDYTGSINNFPVGYCQPVAEKFIGLIKKHFPRPLPIVNGETVYFARHYYPEFYDGIWASEDAPEPNWEKYLWALTKMNDQYPDHRMMSYYWVRCWGTKNYKYHREQGRGVYAELILDIQRKLWPGIDGFENLSEPCFSTAKPVFPLSQSQFVSNESHPFLREVCSPAIVVLDYVAPNRYSGEAVESNAYAINNTERTLDDCTVEIAIVRPGEGDGKTTTLPVGRLEVGERKALPFKIEAPNETGKFELRYKLVENQSRFILFNKPVMLSDRKLELNLRTRADILAPIATGKKVFLYDVVEKVFTGMGMPGTARLLEACKLPFKRVDNFDDLSCDLLVIGANSLDPDVEENAGKIRKYIEDGGNVLLFEQARMGRIPFLREIEYSLAGAGQFAEMVQGRHPAVKDMTQSEFFRWNRSDMAVYTSFISPLSEAAILVGGDSTQWGSDKFGMVAAHLSVGKGTVLVSQAEVTALFDKDSGAAQFARNLLLAALDDQSRGLARKFAGKPAVLEPFPASKERFVSLRPAANMGFADEKAGDGKGGWSDQGPDNDLRKLPVGKAVFEGIPFDIANPADNDGKACVVVSANPKLQFKPAGAPVPVNAKLKRLVFFHTGAWMTFTGKPTGRYTVAYASGKTVEIPLTPGAEIADWWNAPNNVLSKAECVWSCENGKSVVGAYAFPWTNPTPDDEIASVSLESFGDAVIGLLALTGEE